MENIKISVCILSASMSEVYLTPCSFLNTLFQLIWTISTKCIKEYNTLAVNMSNFTNTINRKRFRLLLCGLRWKSPDSLKKTLNFETCAKRNFITVWNDIYIKLSTIWTYLLIQQMFHIMIFLSSCRECIIFFPARKWDVNTRARMSILF